MQALTLNTGSVVNSGIVVIYMCQEQKL
jgi:hypothetical protein